MKFRMKVSDARGKPWWEEKEKPFRTEAEARNYCEEAIRKFNYSLRPGETLRELLEVEITDSSNSTWNGQHLWPTIKENAATLTDYTGRTYDRFRCTHCGTEGRKYSLEGWIFPLRGKKCRDPKKKKGRK